MEIWEKFIKFELFLGPVDKCLIWSFPATESGLGTAPGVYLREDPICGTQLENQSELRAPTADRAAYYLDAALASRAVGKSPFLFCDIQCSQCFVAELHYFRGILQILFANFESPFDYFGSVTQLIYIIRVD